MIRSRFAIALLWPWWRSRRWLRMVAGNGSPQAPRFLYLESLLEEPTKDSGGIALRASRADFGFVHKLVVSGRNHDNTRSTTAIII